MRPAALSVTLLCVAILAGCGNDGASRSDATSPAAGGGYLAWTSGGNKRFAQTATLYGTVTVRRGKTTFRINPPGTQGITGGIDRGRLVYQELDGHGSHLRVFDLRHRRFLPLPGSFGRIPGIVWKPTLFGRFVLFGRIRAGWDVMLGDLHTGQTTLLAQNRAHAGYAVPGQIDGRYAVWLWCSESECTVWRYDLATKRRLRVPISGAAGRGVEGPSVVPDGTVYYGQGGLGCGSTVTLYRYRPGKGISKVASPRRRGLPVLVRRAVRRWRAHPPRPLRLQAQAVHDRLRARSGSVIFPHAVSGPVPMALRRHGGRMWSSTKEAGR